MIFLQDLIYVPFYIKLNFKKILWNKINLFYWENGKDKNDEYENTCKNNREKNKMNDKNLNYINLFHLE